MTDYPKIILCSSIAVVGFIALAIKTHEEKPYNHISARYNEDARDFIEVTIKPERLKELQDRKSRDT